MELSGQSIRDIQFREKLRGYHPDDVDEFVNEVAAGVEALQNQVRELTERVAAAESKAAELASAEESLNRTLVLAQRTADLAVREAREEAASLVAEARAERDAVVSATEELRRQLADEAQAEVRAELARLHEQREQLLADVAALAAFVDTERERLRDVLSEQLRRLDTGELNPSPAPAVHDVEVMPPAPPLTTAADGAVASEAATGGADAAGTADADEAGAHDEAPTDEDAFLAELRRAATDTTPLGPREDDILPLAGGPADDDIFEGVDDEGGRFTSRLRRRR